MSDYGEHRAPSASLVPTTTCMANTTRAYSLMLRDFSGDLNCTIFVDASDGQ